MKLQSGNIFSVICLLTSGFCFSSCEEFKPIYSEVPVIEFVSVSSTSVNAADPLTFRISYTDGDGDLGENTDGVSNLFLSDSRFGTYYSYRVKQLSPNTSIIIKGTIVIELTSAKLTGPSPQSTVFSIYVVDRAGHASNTVISPTVTVY
ncbi:MAG TPA: hypothetical protein VI757_07630 [Bacteroidia bacterium]|nr:hypothetical protein [Bacteroidia bacterium]